MKWIFLVLALVVLLVGVVLALDPHFLLLPFEEALQDVTIPHERQHFEDLYYAFTLSYFAILLWIIGQVWREPAQRFQDLGPIVIFLGLPVLFLSRFLVSSHRGPIHITMAAFFSLLVVVVYGVRRRIRSKWVG